jgi:hypothetical protein
MAAPLPHSVIIAQDIEVRDAMTDYRLAKFPNESF